MKQKYFFPFNYNYSNKLLGIIDYKLLVPLALYAGLLLLFLYHLVLDLFTKIAIFTLAFLPPALILNSQVNSEPFYRLMIAIMKHCLHSKTYLFQGNASHKK